MSPADTYKCKLKSNILPKKDSEYVSGNHHTACKRRRNNEEKSDFITSFTISLFPMFMKQYGGCKGVQEITGMINLLNLIGILSVVLFLAGVWTPFHNKSVNKILGDNGSDWNSDF